MRARTNPFDRATTHARASPATHARANPFDRATTHARASPATHARANPFDRATTHARASPATHARASPFEETCNEPHAHVRLRSARVRSRSGALGVGPRLSARHPARRLSGRADRGDARLSSRRGR